MFESNLIDCAKEFLAALAAGKPREIIEAFYTTDIVQEEFPNRLMPTGAKRDFIHLRAAYDRSRHSIAKQSYEIVNAIASGNTVVLETIWTATLATGFGNLVAGNTMRARFAQVFEFRDARICRIRNYDCFDAW